ncbi:MAG TPA: cobalamin B12-binding domain-containing protein [Desulfobacterales bacterium]|nr:cobalamin B12-binding domain-containing protein [Desulfobacterales bacterium]
MDKEKSRIRVLMAKPGLDGHSRGARVVATLLRNAGMEVIYTGLRQSIDQIVSAAVQEDVDVIALSVLSGVHVELTRKLLAKLKEKGMDIPVIVGGVIPPSDIPELEKLGVTKVFPVHSSFDDILDFFNERFGKN